MGPGGPPGLQNRSLPASAGRLGSTPRRFRQRRPTKKLTQQPKPLLGHTPYCSEIFCLRPSLSICTMGVPSNCISTCSVWPGWTSRSDSRRRRWFQMPTRTEPRRPVVVPRVRSSTSVHSAVGAGRSATSCRPSPELATQCSGSVLIVNTSWLDGLTTKECSEGSEPSRVPTVWWPD